jgi:hypothetical protein
MCMPAFCPYAESAPTVNAPALFIEPTVAILSDGLTVAMAVESGAYAIFETCAVRSRRRMHAYHVSSSTPLTGFCTVCTPSVQ